MEVLYNIRLKYNNLNIVYLVARIIIQKCVFWPRQVRQNTKTKNKSVLVCVLHKVLQINQIELTNNICFRKQHNQTNNVFACQYLPCAMKSYHYNNVLYIYRVVFKFFDQNLYEINILLNWILIDKNFILSNYFLLVLPKF